MDSSLPGRQQSVKLRGTGRIVLIDRIEGFYNSRRMHSAIDYQVPNQREEQLKAV